MFLFLSSRVFWSDHMVGDNGGSLWTAHMDGSSAERLFEDNQDLGKAYSKYMKTEETLRGFYIEQW